MANVFDQVSPPGAGPVGHGPDADRIAGRAERVWSYAGFWWRVLAWGIDTLILSAFDVLINAATGGGLSFSHAVSHGDGAISNISALSMSESSSLASSMTSNWNLLTPNLATILAILAQLAYYTLLESSRWQATVGKRVCQMRVSGLDGGRISPRRALGRNLGKYLSGLILGIGFLMVAWTARKQGLHDLLAETLVVRHRPPSDLVRFNPPPG